MQPSESLLNDLIKQHGEDAFAKAVGTWLARKERDGQLMYPKPEKPARAPHYLAFIRQLPCIHCGSAPPSEAHHSGPRGMSQKTDDYRTMPLCMQCHRKLHDGSLAFDRNFVNGKIAWLLVRYLRIVEGT